MKTFTFANTDYDVYEIFTIKEFETTQAAIDFAYEIAEEMETDVEVYELKHRAEPSASVFGEPSIDNQIAYSWGEALVDSGMYGW